MAELGTVSQEPAPSPADPNLRGGADFAAAALAGGWSEPTGPLTPERSPMAFGYPEFEAAGSGDFEFRVAFSRIPLNGNQGGRRSRRSRHQGTQQAVV